MYVLVFTQPFQESGIYEVNQYMQVPLCAEFAQQEVLEMIRTVLSEELALVLVVDFRRPIAHPSLSRFFGTTKAVQQVVYVLLVNGYINLVIPSQSTCQR